MLKQMVKIRNMGLCTADRTSPSLLLFSSSCFSLASASGPPRPQDGQISTPSSMLLLQCLQIILFAFPPFFRDASGSTKSSHLRAFSEIKSLPINDIHINYTSFRSVCQQESLGILYKITFKYLFTLRVIEKK